VEEQHLANVLIKLQTKTNDGNKKDQTISQLLFNSDQRVL